MFEPITLPFGAKMLFNTVKLKPGVKFEDEGAKHQRKSARDEDAA